MRKYYTDKKDYEICLPKVSNISNGKEGKDILTGSGINKGITWGIYQTC